MNQFILFIIIIIIGIGIPWISDYMSGTTDKQLIEKYERMLHEASVKGDQETADKLIKLLSAMKSRK